MGRYTSVQSYADNNSSVRAISYDQATGSTEPKKGGVKTEKVYNPYGSTAGAGSGEFHTYRHARAREMERWKAMDAQEEEIKKDQEFEKVQLQYQTEEERKTAKRRKKRQREKEAKLRKKNLKAAGIDTSSTTEKKQVDVDDEFTYIPLAKQTEQEEAASSNETKKSTKVDETIDEIPNDGSFLEMMKKRIIEEATIETTGESMGPPPAKKVAIESKIIDEDDDEGPMLPPGFQ